MQKKLLNSKQFFKSFVLKNVIKSHLSHCINFCSTKGKLNTIAFFTLNTLF
jgi:hypothetical protein